MRRKGGGIRIAEGSSSHSSSSSVRPPPQLESDDNTRIIYDWQGNGEFKIEAYIGDVSPICQVFRAEYNNTSHPSRRKQVVALKLARIDQTDADDFMKLRQQVENSIKIGGNLEGCKYIVGIHNAFYYEALYCIPMPYPNRGSIRYILNGGSSRFLLDRRLPERCIAVVLRETLRALRYLHDNGKVHANVNAGNIFVSDRPLAIKLGYQASTYFFNRRGGTALKIWDEEWASKIAPIFCPVSGLPENIFWAATKNRNTGIGIYYEPNNSNLQQECARASDIFNLGITALELALGPFRNYQEQNLRGLEDLRDFLENLLKNETGLPLSLHQLFIVDPQEATAPKTTTTTAAEAAAARTTTAAGATTERKSSDSSTGKMRKKFKIAGKNAKIFLNKAKEKILKRPKTDPKPEPEVPDPEVPDPVQAMFLLSSSFVKMVKRCLVLDPRRRPTAKELLEDQFFKNHEEADLQYFGEVVLEM